MTLGLAFEGCACRCAFHAGVAAALAEGGMRPRIVAGASSGAVIAAAFAAGLGADLPARFHGFAGRSIVSFRRALWNRSPFDMSHLVRGALSDAIGGVDLRGKETEALITATRARDLRRLVFSSHEEPELIDPVMGSCFVPLLYGRHIVHRGELLLDGGIVDNLPLEALAARGADEIIAVVTNEDGTAMKSLRRTRWRPAVHGVKVHVIHPAKALALRSWQLDRDRVLSAVDEGYTRGREMLGA
jgi:NTE family protein